MGIMESSGGGGGPLPMTALQRQARKGRNLAIASVGLATVAVGLSIFSIIQIGRLNTRADLADKQRVSDSTRIVLLDTTKADKTDIAAINRRFESVDSATAFHHWGVTASLAQTDTLGNRMTALETQAGKTDSTLSSLISWKDSVDSALLKLGIVDSTQRADFEKLSQTLSSVDDAVLVMRIYLRCLELHDDWQKGRGGFLFFGGGRPKVPKMAIDDMLGLFDYPKGIDGLKDYKRMFGSDNATAVMLFSRWAEIKGRASQKDVEKWRNGSDWLKKHDLHIEERHIER